LLSQLAGVDFFLSYWKMGPVAHTFVSFCFDNAPPVCISIEVGTEVHEAFAPVASLFKQSELIYVVGDERDLVRVRTNYREEEVYLYRIRTSPERARRLFLVYLDRINELVDRPDFYNLLSNNCTVIIVRAANAAGRDGGFDIRYLLNGLIDRYLYEVGVVNTTLPLKSCDGVLGSPDTAARHQGISRSVHQGVQGSRRPAVPGRLSGRDRRRVPGVRDRKAVAERPVCPSNRSRAAQPTPPHLRGVWAGLPRRN
jgi:hypothetical protein